MKSQIFTYGGGAGIGSYVIVIKDGQIQNPNAEKIRWAYDSGENLFLSIIDDTTEEALLPLSGYVGLDGNLHLSGRDFDDNKTYEFTIENENQSVEMEEVEGITIGEGTIPTEGGGGGSELSTNTYVRLIYGQNFFTGVLDETVINDNLPFNELVEILQKYNEKPITVYIDAGNDSGMYSTSIGYLWFEEATEDSVLFNIESSFGVIYVSISTVDGGSIDWSEVVNFAESGGGDSRSVLHTDFKIKLSYNPETSRPLPDLMFVNATGRPMSDIPDEFADTEGYGDCIVNKQRRDELAHYYYTNDGQELYISLEGQSFSLEYYISLSTGLCDLEQSYFNIHTFVGNPYTVNLVYGDERACDFFTDGALQTREDYKFFLDSINSEQILANIQMNDGQGGTIVEHAVVTTVTIPESDKDPMLVILSTSHGDIAITIQDKPSEEEYPTFNFTVDWSGFYSPAGGGGSSGDSIPVLSDYFWVMNGYTAQLFRQSQVTSMDSFPSEFESPTGCYVGVGFGRSGKIYRCQRIKPRYYALTREDDSIIIRCEVDEESDNLTCYVYFCTEEEFFNYNPNFIVLSACTDPGAGDMDYEKVYLSRDSMIQSLNLHAFAGGGQEPIIDQNGNAVNATVSPRYIVCHGFGPEVTVIALQTVNGR